MVVIATTVIYLTLAPTLFDVTLSKPLSKWSPAIEDFLCQLQGHTEFQQ